jgi:putative ABC transport system permease protein
MNLAMVVAVFISCMGLFGLILFSSTSRQKEISIRKVLGASVPGIVFLLSKDFLKLVFIAMLIASPVVYYFMHLWLQDYAYRIQISWWMFAMAWLSALVIAFLTISFQAIKSGLANPVNSLRTE